jgi:hypothetical protein
MDHTTPPKEDKVGTLSAEAPTTQALVAQPKSEVLDDNLGGDAPDLLNNVVVGSEIACRMSSRLQMCWPDSRKLDCLVWDFGSSDFHAPDAFPTFLVIHQEDIEGGLWATLWLAPLIAIGHPSYF